jgi:hypothetical protein
MNAYLATTIAHDHFDRLVAASANSRLVKEARQARRAQSTPRRSRAAHAARRHAA